MKTKIMVGEKFISWIQFDQKHYCRVKSYIIIYLFTLFKIFTNQQHKKYTASVFNQNNVWTMFSIEAIIRYEF